MFARGKFKPKHKHRQVAKTLVPLELSELLADLKDSSAALHPPCSFESATP